MQTEINISGNQLGKLADAVEKAGKSLSKELAIACNQTAKELKTPISQSIRTVLNAKAKGLKKVISVGMKATESNITASTKVNTGRRIPLKEFGAKQKKDGVSYKIFKGGKMRTVKRGFMGPKPGVQAIKLKGHAFMRKQKEQRLPIVKLFGPSVKAAFQMAKLEKPIAEEAEKRLTKKINRRIQFALAKVNR